MTGSKSDSLSIAVTGAHLDDAWLGMGGVLLKAARNGHRVTMIQAVSTYGAWPVVDGLGDMIRPRLQKLADDNNMKLVTLGHDYMRVKNNPELIDQLAHAIVEAAPDILFCQWEDDDNQDHVELGAASRVAAIHARCFVHPEKAEESSERLPPSGKIKLPSEIYYYRTSHEQTRNFVPDHYVDVSQVIFDVLELCNVFADIYSQRLPQSNVAEMTIVDHRLNDRGVTLVGTIGKLALTINDGRRCSARYAEGFRAYEKPCAERQLLARI